MNSEEFFKTRIRVFGPKDQNCPICEKSMKIGILSRIPKCEHIFHETCIFSWLTDNVPTCPTCSTPASCKAITEKELIRHITMARTMEDFRKTMRIPVRFGSMMKQFREADLPPERVYFPLYIGDKLLEHPP